MDEHQRLVLAGALGERPDGKWAALEVAVNEPRQNGKGDIKIARQLAGMFLFGEGLQTHTAHRADTSLEHFRRIRDVIDGCDWLRRRVKRVSETNGKESIELVGGNRLQFKARSKGSGRGFTGDVVYLDEAMWMQDLGSMLPSLSAKSVIANPQVWYTGSAPLDRLESETWKRIVRRGRQGDGRLAYFEWSADVDLEVTPLDKVDLDDQGLWAQANPAFGVRIGAEFIASVERKTMTPEDFARERLGVWRDFDDGEPAIPISDWQACCTETMTLADPVVIGVDVTPDRNWSSLVAAGHTSGGPGVDLIDHGRGTKWVTERLVELVANHDVAKIVLDGTSAAGSLIASLETAGLDVTVADTQGHKKACGALFDLIVNRELVHLAQPDLEAAVVGASKREVGDAWLWNRRAGADISPLVAATLAVAGLQDPPEQSKPVFAY